MNTVVAWLLQVMRVLKAISKMSIYLTWAT